MDEIWAFCGMKQKTARKQGRARELGVGYGWTFTAIDDDTKLAPSWLVGSRDISCATEFLQDLSGRLLSRDQLTSDGRKMYRPGEGGARLGTQGATARGGDDVTADIVVSFVSGRQGWP